MMPNRPDTLRELGTLEEPKRGEIVWLITDPIRTHGQLALAKALEKRLKRGIKRVEDNSIMKAQLEQVRFSIKEWHDKHCIYDQVQYLKEFMEHAETLTDERVLEELRKEDLELYKDMKARMEGIANDGDKTDK